MVKVRVQLGRPFSVRADGTVVYLDEPKKKSKSSSSNKRKSSSRRSSNSSVDKGTLVNYVKNLSVYTREEREKWIEKIKRGDTEAISKARKLYEKGRRARKEYEEKAKELVKKKGGGRIHYVGGRFVDEEGKTYYYDEKEGRFKETEPTSTAQYLRNISTFSSSSTDFEGQKEALRKEREYRMFLKKAYERRIKENLKDLDEKIGALKKDDRLYLIVEGRKLYGNEAISYLESEKERLLKAKSEVEAIDTKDIDEGLKKVEENKIRYNQYLDTYAAYHKPKLYIYGVSKYEPQIGYDIQKEWESAQEVAKSIYETSYKTKIKAHGAALFEDINMFRGGSLRYIGSAVGWGAIKTAEIFLPEKYDVLLEKKAKEWLPTPSDIAKERLAKRLYILNTGGIEAYETYKKKQVAGTLSTVALTEIAGYGSVALSNVRWVPLLRPGTKAAELAVTAVRTAPKGIGIGMGITYAGMTGYDVYEGIKEKDLSKAIGDIAAIPMFYFLGKAGAGIYQKTFEGYMTSIKTPKTRVEGRGRIITRPKEISKAIKGEGTMLIKGEKNILLEQKPTIGRYKVMYEKPESAIVNVNTPDYKMKFSTSFDKLKVYSKVVKGNRRMVEYITGDKYHYRIVDIGKNRILFEGEGKLRGLPITKEPAKAEEVRVFRREKLPIVIEKEMQSVNEGLARMKQLNVHQVKKISYATEGNIRDIVEIGDAVWKQGKLVRTTRLKEIRGMDVVEKYAIPDKEFKVVIEGKKPLFGRKLKGGLSLTGTKIKAEAIQEDMAKILKPEAGLKVKLPEVKFDISKVSYDFRGLKVPIGKPTIKGFGIMPIKVGKGEMITIPSTGIKDVIKMPTKPIQEPQMPKLESIQTYQLKQPPIEQPMTRVVSEPIPQEVSVPKIEITAPKVEITPPLITTALPPRIKDIGGFSLPSKPKPKYGRGRFKYSYAPSLVAIEFGIKAPRVSKEVFSGLEIRPIISPTRRTKRGRRKRRR